MSVQLKTLSIILLFYLGLLEVKYAQVISVTKFANKKN